VIISINVLTVLLILLLLRATAVPSTGRYCWARISYGNYVRPSVHLSVTTRYQIKPRWDRDSGFLPYDSLEFLVSYERICAAG